MIRVLIVEDSVTQREILRRMLLGDGSFEIVAEAVDGRQAIEMVSLHRPDVVLMDIHMPDIDGIAATREIMRRRPVPVVLASATLKKRDIDLAMEGYAAGAVSVIEKPDGAVLLHLDEIGPALRRELHAAAEVRFPEPIPSLSRAASPTPVPSQAMSGKKVSGTFCAKHTQGEFLAKGTGHFFPQAGRVGIEVIGICASTGGPPVLAEIFSSLPNSFPIPILLVQHISRSFEEAFARWLAKASGRQVSIAADGQPLAPGIRLAPAGADLTLSAGSRLQVRPAVSGSVHCPSGNPLFASLAARQGPAAAGILLTGMGNDGAEGLRALHQAGGTTIIQDEMSSLIWGMPKAAAALGAAEYALNPAEIAAAMIQMTKLESGTLKTR